MKTGDGIHHDRFGPGTLLEVKGDRLRIQFVDGSERAFSFQIARDHLRGIDRPRACAPSKKKPKAARLRKIRLPRVMPPANEPGIAHCNQCGKDWHIIVKEPKVCRNCGSKHWNGPKRDKSPVMKSAGDDRRKYWPTPKIDARIRQAYAEYIGENDRLALGRCAHELNWPKFAVTRRASQLNLVRIKEPNWSEAEIDVLQRFAHLTPDRIALHLQAMGFKRTRVAVNLKVKRLSLREDLQGYSCYKLSLAFGIDSHAVARWIQKKLLAAELKGTARKDSQGGDSYYVTHTEVKRFVFAHPEEVDLRKVDKYWFLDLVTDGQISDNQKLVKGATA